MYFPSEESLASYKNIPLVERYGVCAGLSIVFGDGDFFEDYSEDVIGLPRKDQCEEFERRVNALCKLGSYVERVVAILHGVTKLAKENAHVLSLLLGGVIDGNYIGTLRDFAAALVKERLSEKKLKMLEDFVALKPESPLTWLYQVKEFTDVQSQTIQGILDIKESIYWLHKAANQCERLDPNSLAMQILIAFLKQI